MKKLTLFFVFLGALSGIHGQEAGHEFRTAKDILWASPDGFDLTMDIYTPDTGKKKYPVLIIYHGGGWLINNKSIMDQMSEYVVSHGEYVVCNVNYRLLGDQNNSVTLDQIVEDALGGVLWVKENISEYGGNPKKIAVTGDSAGGHLAEMVLLAANKLCSSGFTEDVYCFKPSYLPEGKSAEDIAKKNGLEVQAAVISYGAFDLYASAKGGFEKPSNFFWNMGGAEPRGIFGSDHNYEDDPDRYQSVSPVYLLKEGMNLPPQFFHVGSLDQTTTPSSVKSYYEEVVKKGYEAEYWVHEGRNHAYLDSGTNEFLGLTFEKDAIEPLDKIIAFLDGVFY